ncbi:hypothetical protein [Prosthecochloris aestuarii]|nr:hypothetical protein [Prosthecochloris aestuarii]
MNSMNKMASALSIGVFCMTGCTTVSTVPTAGDSMVIQGEDSRSIGQKWNTGQRSIQKGEQLKSSGLKMMEKGQKMVAEGQKNVEKGDQSIMQGKLLKQQSEHEYRQKFPDQKLLPVDEIPATQTSAR